MMQILAKIAEITLIIVKLFQYLRAKGSILLKKYYNYFDPKVKEFGTSELIKADIDGKHNDAH